MIFAEITTTKIEVIFDFKKSIQNYFLFFSYLEN